jgi:hypothetical protein
MFFSPFIYMLVSLFFEIAREKNREAEEDRS